MFILVGQNLTSPSFWIWGGLEATFHWLSAELQVWKKFLKSQETVAMGSFFSKFPEIRHPFLLKMESNADFFSNFCSCKFSDISQNKIPLVKCLWRSFWWKSANINLNQKKKNLEKKKSSILPHQSGEFKWSGMAVSER